MVLMANQLNAGNDMSDDKTETDTNSSEGPFEAEYTIRSQSVSSDSNASLTENEGELHASLESDSPYFSAPLTDPLYSADFTAEVMGCSVHPENENVVAVCAENKFYLWNMDTNSAIFEQDIGGIIHFHGFSHDGKFIFVYASNETLRVFEVDTMRLLWDSSEKESTKLVYLRAQWHPSRNTILAISDDSEVLIIVEFPSCEVKEIHYAKPVFGCCAFPAEDRALVGLPNTLCVCDLNASKILNSFPDEDRRCMFISTISINHAGTLAAYAYRYYFLKIISLSSGEIIAKVQYGIHHSSTYDVVLEFSANDNFLAAGNGIGELRIFTVPSFEVHAVYKNDYKTEIKSISWNDDATLYLMTYDGYVHLIDCNKGEKLKTYHCHREVLYQFQLFKNKDKFLTGSGDKTIKVFEV